MCEEMLQMDEKMLLQNRTFSTKRRVTWVRWGLFGLVLAAFILMAYLSITYRDRNSPPFPRWPEGGCEAGCIMSEEDIL